MDTTEKVSGGGKAGSEAAETGLCWGSMGTPPTASSQDRADATQADEGAPGRA